CDLCCIASCDGAVQVSCSFGPPEALECACGGGAGRVVRVSDARVWGSAWCRSGLARLAAASLRWSWSGAGGDTAVRVGGAPRGARRWSARLIAARCGGGWPPVGRDTVVRVGGGSADPRYERGLRGTATARAEAEPGAAPDTAR
ncbi:hypothetical protein R5W24_006578, partial [Gemmata sp. JC717]|uniref:hypothetical protein n=1 Tax=Gemmata algarum TaxID=2975278 RepID=UPI0021BB8B7D